MLNSQTLIICCLFFAAVWAGNRDELAKEIADENWIKYLENCISYLRSKSFNNKKYPAMLDSIYWDDWQYLPYYAKVVFVLPLFQDALTEKGVSRKSGVTDKTAYCAYLAYNNFYDQQLENFKTYVHGHEDLLKGINDLYNQKPNFFEFLLFFYFEYSKKEVREELGCEGPSALPLLALKLLPEYLEYRDSITNADASTST